MEAGGLGMTSRPIKSGLFLLFVLHLILITGKDFHAGRMHILYTICLKHTFTRRKEEKRGGKE